jgi:hypothetical protein
MFGLTKEEVAGSCNEDRNRDVLQFVNQLFTNYFPDSEIKGDEMTAAVGTHRGVRCTNKIARSPGRHWHGWEHNKKMDFEETGM